MTGYRKECLAGRSPAIYLYMDSRLLPVIFIYIYFIFSFPSRTIDVEKDLYIGRPRRSSVNDDSGRLRRYD